MRIKPNTTVNTIRKRLGKSERARKRESERRRLRLEKLANWVGDKKVKVQFVPEGASCQPAPSGASYDLLVKVPTEEHDQPATELEPSVWDFVFQKAELVHELGHVIYTDFEAYEEYLEEISDLRSKRLFQNLFNINEDGAIERQLAVDFNVGEDLEIKNANLMVQGEPGAPHYSGGREHLVHHAVESILMDWAKYDTGRAERLLDPADTEYTFTDDEARQRTIEFLPTLRDMTEDIVTEPNGRERVKLTYEYFRELESVLEDAGEVGEGGILMNLMQAFPNDGDVYVVMPGEPPEEAEALEPDENDTVIFMDPGEYAQQQDDDEEGGEGEERSIEAKYGEAIEADDDGSDEADEAEQWLESVESTGNALNVVQSGTADMDTWSRGEQYGDRYERALKQALAAERESSTSYNERAGRPDVQNLWQLGYGNSRVFMGENEPEEKEYSVVLVLDRSGSMGGDAVAPWIIDEAEAVTIGLALALERLGAEVAILSVAGDAYLEKSWGDSVESKKNVLARNESSGGTPLGKTLELAKDQLDGRTGEKLVFAITDGEPTDGGRYENTLEQVTFPVAGVYMADGRAPDTDDVGHLYHRIVSAAKEDVGQRAEGMIKRLAV